MFFSLLNVFLWKNGKRILFYWKTNILCILIPLLLTTFIIQESHREDDSLIELKNGLLDYKFQVVDEPHIAETEGHSDKIMFIPNTTFFSDLMYEVGYMLHMPAENVVGFESEADLYKQFRASNGSYNVIIIFELLNTNDHLSYTIRKKSNDFETEKIYQPKIISSRYSNPYAYNGFIGLQYAIEKNYLIKKTNETLPTFSMQHNPMKYVKPPADIDLSSLSWINLFAFILVFSTIILYPLVEEKQDGIKEILNIATTYSYINQVAVFFLSFGICVVITVVILVQCIVYNVFDCTNIVFPFILTILFICCMISFTFFVSTFFDSVTYSLIVGCLFFLAPIFFFEYSKNPVMLAIRILSPCTMYLDGMSIFDKFIATQRCFELKHLFLSDHPVNGYSLFDMYLALILTSFLYLFLYYYLSNVFPGKCGTPRPFYFMFVPSYWRSNKVNSLNEPLTVNHSVTSKAKPIVQVQNLTKTFQPIPIYGAKFCAVKGISFELPENRITILLGHNGAGKTTTMSMITGIIPPTSGDIMVGNQRDVAVYRSTIGYCPQNDVFISYMSCMDHLIFFGRLRGLPKEEAIEESRIILDKVRLTKSANKPAKQLSSGMKRRLCLACAVIGQTKLVILDEPSTGLDPESRRDLWDVLLPLRKERSILLTTHSMEEADVLGDKIIIMDHGNIVCEGTQLALKREYGFGYTLKILMGNTFKLNETLESIKRFVPSASIKSNVNPTIQIVLPYDSIKMFSSTLEALEKNKTILGIESISMTNTTMEEVFLNSATEKIKLRNDDDSDEVDSKYLRIDDQEPEKRSNFYIYLNQAFAIFYKKFVFIKKSWLRFLIHCALPVLAIICTYYTQISIQTALKEEIIYQSLDISSRHIRNPEILLVLNRNVTDYDRIVDTFEAIGKEQKVNTIIVQNKSITEVLNDIEKNDVVQYYEKLMAAIEIKDINNHLHLKFIYQGNIRYSNPYALNLASNLILKMYTNVSEGISLINSPLQRIGPETVNVDFMYTHVYPWCMPLGFFFYILFYLNLPFIEETTDFKIIQNIPISLYWIISYLSDCVLHTLCCIGLIMVTAGFDTGKLLTNDILTSLFVVLCLIGYVYMPLLYILAKSFRKLSSIYSLLFYLLFISAFAAIFFTDEKTTLDYKYIFAILRFVPEFNIRFELHHVIVYKTYNLGYSMNQFLKYSFFEIFLFMGILIFIYENIYVLNWFTNMLAMLNPRRCCTKKPEEEIIIVDPYVQAEKDMVKKVIKTGETSDYTLVVSGLEKYYSDFHAVKGVDFSVKKGECFGLLGMNGAGKSTIFKMLTLNNPITKGDILINGFHCKKQKHSYVQQYGYCPELHSLLDFMTAYEMLKYMAWIKGTSVKHLDAEVKLWLKKMDLMAYRNVTINNYSGGTKRKLNTAISMISNPYLIFLDEPTSGVDPVSRRFMWQCIKEFQKEKKTIVLTSHSMDECEELCNRLAIMTSGQFKCIGFIQKLKEIFGSGFTLLIKIRDGTSETNITNIKLGVANMYRCTLRDDYAGTLIYHVMENNIKWSIIFEKIEEFCEKNSAYVEDFAITEISLEDIFLQFRQDENNGIEISRL